MPHAPRPCCSARGGAAVLLALLLVASRPAQAELVATTLGTLARQADVVARGRVVAVVAVPAGASRDGDEARVAIVSVSHALRGGRRGDRLVVWLHGTAPWNSHDTSASVRLGDESLWILERGAPPGAVAPSHLARIRRAVSGATIHRVAMEGRGRLRIVRAPTGTVAEVWVRDTSVPWSITARVGPGNSRDAPARRVPLDRLVGHLRAALRPPAPPRDANARATHAVLARLDRWPLEDGAWEAVAALGTRALPTIRRILARDASPRRDPAIRLLVALDVAGQVRVEAGHDAAAVATRRMAYRALATACRIAPEALEWDDARRAVLRAGLVDADAVVRRFARLVQERHAPGADSR